MPDIRVNVRDYGAAGNSRISRAQTKAGSVTLGTRQPLFDAADVGVPIIVLNGRPDGQRLLATIASIKSATQIDLTAPPSVDMADAEIIWGHDDTAAIRRAAEYVRSKPSGSLYFPTGRYLMLNGIVVEGTELTITGDGPDQSIIQAGIPRGPLFTLRGSRLRLGNLGFDTSGVMLRGAVDAEIQMCRFFRPATVAVHVANARELRINSTLVESPGDASGTGVLIEAATGVEVSHCTFRYLKNGVIVHTIHDGSEPPRAITIADNKFDLGWWLTVPAHAGKGPLVTYTANSVTDSAAMFSTFDKNATVRSVRAISSGNGVATEMNVTDPNGHFAVDRVRRGDLVRMGSLLAVVSSVVADGQVIVEEWMQESDRLKASPPRPGPYVVERCLIGKVVSASGHAIQVDLWRDWMGVVQTPPAGSRYEAARSAGNYAIHAEPGSSDIYVRGNNLVAGYSDQISLWGSGGVVDHNEVRDGEDMGITLNGGPHHVTNNTITHQGAGGIYVGCHDTEVKANLISETPWMNATNTSYLGGLIVFGGARKNTIRDNTISATAALALRRYGLVVYSRDPQHPVVGNVIENNRSSGHSVADILLSIPNTSENSIGLNSGTVVRMK